MNFSDLAGFPAFYSNYLKAVAFLWRAFRTRDSLYRKFTCGNIIWMDIVPCDSTVVLINTIGCHVDEI